MEMLATPKKDSYVIKAESVPKIAASKTSKETMTRIKKNAEAFRTKNLKNTQRM